MAANEIQSCISLSPSSLCTILNSIILIMDRSYPRATQTLLPLFGTCSLQRFPNVHSCVQMPPDKSKAGLLRVILGSGSCTRWLVSLALTPIIPLPLGTNPSCLGPNHSHCDKSDWVIVMRALALVLALALALALALGS